MVTETIRKNHWDHAGWVDGGNANFWLTHKERLFFSELQRERLAGRRRAAFADLPPGIYTLAQIEAHAMKMGLVMHDKFKLRCSDATTATEAAILTPGRPGTRQPRARTASDYTVVVLADEPGFQQMLVMP